MAKARKSSKPSASAQPTDESIVTPARNKKTEGTTSPLIHRTGSEVEAVKARYAADRAAEQEVRIRHVEGLRQQMLAKGINPDANVPQTYKSALAGKPPVKSRSFKGLGKKIVSLANKFGAGFKNAFSMENKSIPVQGKSATEVTRPVEKPAMRVTGSPEFIAPPVGFKNRKA